ncbi:unnamed protein product [Durusdinium trenchii]|uniref:Uncharacterized protein n=1 Tax=Durusdinium trenchii TaxID=1381693 RepID=A0ABP0NIQ6_9DINO
MKSFRRSLVLKIGQVLLTASRNGVWESVLQAVFKSPTCACGDGHCSEHREHHEACEHCLPQDEVARSKQEKQRGQREGRGRGSGDGLGGRSRSGRSRAQRPGAGEKPKRSQPEGGDPRDHARAAGAPPRGGTAAPAAPSARSWPHVSDRIGRDEPLEV